MLKRLIRSLYWRIFDDDEFIESAYRLLFGREADGPGAKHFKETLLNGDLTRKNVIEEFVKSEEFKNYRPELKFKHDRLLTDYVTLFNSSPFLPFVKKTGNDLPPLCELANPRKWRDQEWLDLHNCLKITHTDPDKMHRKAYEWTQAIYGLSKLVQLEEARCLGVGAGHEPIIYWLANHTKEVVATDMYDDASNWSTDHAREGDASMLINPAQFAPFPYREERLTVKKMDGRNLEFSDASFDLVFSLSSIEHFGGNKEAAKAMSEIGRTLRPGGVAAVATELILNDGSHPEFFSVDELLEFVVAPSGLLLVQLPLFEAPRVALDDPVEMPDERYCFPHIILREKGVIFTSVILFLVKPDQTI